MKPVLFRVALMHNDAKYYISGPTNDPVIIIGNRGAGEYSNYEVGAVIAEVLDRVSDGETTITAERIA